MALALLVAACGPSSGGNAGVDWSQQSSAQGGGGLSALIAAARKEGTLNLPSRPRDSVAYTANVEGFVARYGIHVTISATATDDASQIGAVKRAGSTADALDILDLNPAVANANTTLLAPYLTFYWLQIPASLKHGKAYWYDACGGYMAIGYDSQRVPVLNSVTDLLGPAYRGSVALVGDPARELGALSAVVMASVAAGGSAGDIAPGVDFFHRLQAAGNLVPWGPPGPPPVLLDWDFEQGGYSSGSSGWTFTVPADASVAGYRAQAVNRDAPHPAAARLWEEYLLSDTGQNACLHAHGRPARLAAMTAEGTIAIGGVSSLTRVEGAPILPTPAQLAAAESYVAANWPAAVGA